VGDIVGEPGRRAARALIPGLREKHGLAVVVANGENSAGGSGITVRTAEEIFSAGVDVITCGDHLWDQKEVEELLKKEPRFLRPANYPEGTLGRGGAVFHLENLPPFGVVNAQGRTFMAALENPFPVARELVDELREETSIILVDFHAEATSEKIAMGRYLDGLVSAVVGTHTHVQTADEQIFPGGTGFLCDAGFTGGHESILGRDIEPVVQRFLKLTPQRFKVSKGRVKLQGVIIDVNEATGRARGMERVSEEVQS